MDYKLSKSEFYRIGFLLAGLFMFLFLFGILSLSSFAEPNSKLVVKTGNGGVGGSCTVNVSTDIRINYTVGINNVVHMTNSLYVTTSEGTYLLYSSSFSKAYGTYTESMGILGGYSVTLPGQFVNAYVTSVAQADYNLSSTDYIVDAVYLHSANDFISFTNSNFSDSDLFNFSDYSSYSPVNILNSFDTNSPFGNSTFNVGQIYEFNFPDYSGTSSAFGNAWVFFNNTSNSHYTYSIYYSSSSYFTSIPNTNLYIRDSSGADVGTYPFNVVNVGSSDPNIRRYYAFCSFDLPTEGIYQCYVGNSFPATVFNVSYSLNVYKGTIADYMKYVQSQWDNISPNVTVTNQNIAQSQSDIGTAQTFETSAFTDFDSSMSNSGLDQFSLSFNSTPLFWCASIINTFYNNMPVGFQYLLTFVAFIGILCTVLNIFGRVAQRFGDRDSSSLNKHDVFSRIEKHGSI